MVSETFFPFILEKMISILPRWLARLFISSRRVASQVEIDLRSIKPAEILFGTDLPSLRLHFKISNLSLINLVLDRFLIDLWVGQPTLQGAILTRYDIPKRKSREEIFFRHELTIPQQEQIKNHAQDRSVAVTIAVKAYFESKSGMVLVEKKFDHIDVPVE